MLFFTVIHEQQTAVWLDKHAWCCWYLKLVLKEHFQSELPYYQQLVLTLLCPLKTTDLPEPTFLSYCCPYEILLYSLRSSDSAVWQALSSLPPVHHLNHRQHHWLCQHQVQTLALSPSDSQICSPVSSQLLWHCPVHVGGGAAERQSWCQQRLHSFQYHL